jgi:hypothetical protein
LFSSHLQNCIFSLPRRDPINFAQKLIKTVVWPVLSDRLNRIEVPNIREESSKTLYAIEDIVIHVTSFPKVRLKCLPGLVRKGNQHECILRMEELT